MDYGEFKYSINAAPNVFNVTFDVIVNGKFFLINFSNEPLINQNPALTDTFNGSGASYIQFLKEVESSPDYQGNNGAESEANNIIGVIAQSIYFDVQSHSPDQDEE